MIIIYFHHINSHQPLTLLIVIYVFLVPSKLLDNFEFIDDYSTNTEYCQWVENLILKNKHIKVS